MTEDPHCSTLRAPENWNRCLYEGSYGMDNYVEKGFLRCLYINPEFETISRLQYFYNNVYFAIKILTVTNPIIIYFILSSLFPPFIPQRTTKFLVSMGFLLGGCCIWLLTTNLISNASSVYRKIIKFSRAIAVFFLYLSSFLIRDLIQSNLLIAIIGIIAIFYLFLSPTLDIQQLHKRSVLSLILFIFCLSFYVPTYGVLIIYLLLSFLSVYLMSLIPQYYVNHYVSISLCTLLVCIAYYYFYSLFNMYLAVIFALMITYTLFIAPCIQYQFQFKKLVFRGPWDIPDVKQQKKEEQEPNEPNVEKEKME